ncbi:23S rRNA (uracil(1939)-C(5))-methyltransferase RlmD [Nosocomiicoccus sp. HMSC059G07]|uniref:23S rRNA (uracil(1939)-C(5))-methyltransferase RlmD n=1 Tax=Nosocomiicoccus sp. HMSC059G07 TaxID=1739531 RepID=UPI0008A2E6FB|nr:23S rRNA (uracil(1939)-C(5))-methyltransferase RlmD [Nosocomiicoccus sp. HMSC059G07]OFO55055.1 23S rRNA (uracil-5-)-methyltransferase RumA [Nosocomiicoccus sp. HMSC059G07]
MSKSRIYDVTIKSFNKKGQGVTKYRRDDWEGKGKNLRLTVPRTIPGEVVRVNVPNAMNRKSAFTHPIEIIKKDENRIDAPCKYFDICGGCQWQHFDYNAQLKVKENAVKMHIENNGFDPSVIRPIIGAENMWRYRNKMEFTFGSNGELGLHEMDNFRNIIDLDSCLIAGAETEKVMNIVSEWAKQSGIKTYNKDTKEGILRYLMVRESQHTGEVMCAIFAADDPERYEAEINQLLKTLVSEIENIESITWSKNTDLADMTQSERTVVLHGRDYIHDEMYGFNYRLWFDTFFQTNPRQAEKLVDLAIEFANPTKDQSMIDLFCGVGTFSLPFATRVKRLAGIEIVESSIESAKQNAEDNDVTNTYFLAKDARRGIDEVLENWGRPDVIMLDPPRSGAGGKVMRRIGRLQTDRVVYVSCNPETFAKDITWLRDFGYELKIVQPVDLFPHTVHVELVALLSRVEK